MATSQKRFGWDFMVSGLNNQQEIVAFRIDKDDDSHDRPWGQGEVGHPGRKMEGKMRRRSGPFP
jgi:hypothetical protein